MLGKVCGKWNSEVGSFGANNSEIRAQEVSLKSWRKVRIVKTLNRFHKLFAPRWAYLLISFFHEHFQVPKYNKNTVDKQSLIGQQMISMKDSGAWPHGSESFMEEPEF